MMSAGVLSDRIEILRAAPATPAAVDDWNNPAYQADAAVVTVDGRIAPRSEQEQAQLADAGAVTADYSGIVLTIDVTERDRLRRVADGAVFEIRSRRAIPSFGGGTHHVKLLLSRVTP